VTESAETIRETINANTENVTESIREGALQNFRNILVLTELILLAITISSEQMSKKITDPIRQLEHDVNVISTGNLKQRVEVSSEDEIGSLAASFNNMADSLEKYIADVKEMTAKEERMAADMALAKQIQAAMLPKNFEEFTEGRNFELHASMKPAKDVGGDFYDFFMIDDTHLALAIADVSGKGVPAALFMARAMTSLRMRSLAGGSLSQIMSDVNDAMCERNDEGLFVTIWMAVIDLETGRGLASNAGHENPVLRRAGGSYRVVNYKHSIFIGAMQGMPFEEHSFQLKAGDSIFVYTDGVAEAKREEKLFGTTRLTRTLNRDPDADPVQVIRNVDEAILEFTAGEEQFDDITMLCVKYLGPDSAESPEKS
jgi:serine phosphatase RsbU (regulator of sigma subunit)